MASFVPVNYVVTDTKMSKDNPNLDQNNMENLNKTNGSLGLPNEESDTYDQMRELINNPVDQNLP